MKLYPTRPSSFCRTIKDLKNSLFLTLKSREKTRVSFCCSWSVHKFCFVTRSKNDKKHTKFCCCFDTHLPSTFSLCIEDISRCLCELTNASASNRPHDSSSLSSRKLCEQHRTFWDSTAALDIGSWGLATPTPSCVFSNAQRG